MSPLPLSKDVPTDEQVLIEEARVLFGEDWPGWAQVEAAGRQQVDQDGKPLTDNDRRKLQMRELRRLLHGLTDDDIPTALCLSGGGIRSATFSLGVVQGLAERHLLPKFHYLSSVSGGGYLASWLSAWVRNEAQARPVEESPNQAFDAAQQKVFKELGQVGHAQDEEPAPLSKLRAYSSYLSPVRGISADLLTLLAIYIRNLTLNWLVLVPVLVAALLLPRLHVAAMHARLLLDTTSRQHFVDLLAWIALALVFSTIAYMASDLPADPKSLAPVGKRETKRPPQQHASVFWPLVAPLGMAAILICWLIAWRARTDMSPSMVGWIFDAGSTCCLGKLLGELESGSWGQVLPTMQAHGLLLAGIAGGMIQALASLLGGTLLRQARGIESGTRPATPAAAAAVFFSGCLTGAGLFLMAQGLHALASHQGDLLLLATIGVPLLMWLFWFGVTLYAGWRRPIGHEDEREWFARAAGQWIGFSALWLIAFGLVMYLPSALLEWSGIRSDAGAAGLGAGTGAMGLLLAAIGYLSKHGPAWLQRAETFAEKIGLRMLDLLSIIFIVFFLCGLSMLAALASRSPPQNCATEALWAEPYRSRDALSTLGSFLQITSVAPQKGDALPSLGKMLATTPRCVPLVRQDFIGHYEWRLVHGAHWGELLTAILLCVAIPVLLSRRFGVNAFSLHSMYGNRLVRAYLAASRDEKKRRPHWFTGFDPKDNLPMHELWPRPAQPAEPDTRTEPVLDGESPPPSSSSSRIAPLAPGPRPRRLFHVVNIALNIVKASGSRLEWQDRKATSFTVSPLHSGSKETSYVRSEYYVASPDHRGISLGGAMTISGAAASPNMGYHSSVPLAFVMTLFNLRLGMWMPNPRWPLLKGGLDHGWPWKHNEPGLGLTALWNEAMGNTDSASEFLYLSDGGHFDNMGLYEMVRRRCRRIVLVDAVADPDYAYGDLLSTLRKIRIDLGIEITFPRGLPGPVDKGLSGHAIAEGLICYRNADKQAVQGTLVLIKPCLPEDAGGLGGSQLPLDVRRYAVESARGKNRFPQQSTSDQFFDESQFESYRMLGLYLTRNGFDDGELTPRALHPPRRAPVSAAVDAGAHVVSTATEVPDAKDGAGAYRPSPDLVGNGASSLMQQVKNNIGTIAASAVVSTAAVTGAVQLTDRSVKIANPELQLKLPIAPRGDPGPAASGVSGTLDTIELQAAVASATQATARLAGNIDGLNAAASAAKVEVGAMAIEAKAAVASVAAFKAELKGLKTGGDGPVTVTLDSTSFGEISKAAAAARDAAASSSEAAKAARDAASQTKLSSQYLQDIRNRIAQTPPRSNARGSNGDQ